MSPSYDQQAPEIAAACPRCAAQAPIGAQFCPACGNAIPIRPLCRACGAMLPEGANFCRWCGAAESASAAPAGLPMQATDPVAQSFATGAQPGAPAAERKPRAAWWSVVLMMINPGQVLAQRMANVSWPFALAVSGGAFTLFFLQTGLDRARVGTGGAARTAILAVTGALYGTAGVALIGFVAWGLSRAFGGNHPTDWAIRALALSYGSTLVYAVFGLFFNIFLGWNTSVAFGVTGVLWALGPMIAVFKELSGGKTGGSILLATVCGGLVLFGWAALAA